MKKAKITLLSFHIESRHTGEAESFFNLIKFLKKEGLDVKIKGLEKVFKKEVGFSPRGENVALKSLRFLTARRVLETEGKNADVLHVFVPVPFLSFIVKGLDKRTVITVESSLSNISLKELPSLLPHDAIFYLTRFLLNNKLVARLFASRSAEYTVSTSYQKKELEKLGIESRRISIVPNIWNTEKCRKMDRFKARAVNNISGEPLIAYVGHFLHYKGIMTLIRAFYFLTQEIENARLVLAWSRLGNLQMIKRAIKRYKLEDKIFLLDRVDISSVLSACDMLVLPYLFNYGTVLYPNTLLECFDIGVPLVCSDVACLKDIVKDGKTAVVFKAGDALSLKKAVERLWKDKSLQEKLIKEQRQISATVLSPGKTARKYKELYDAILGK